MYMILAAVWPFNKIQKWFQEVVTDIINGIVNLVGLAFAEGGSFMNDGLISKTFEANAYR